MYKTKGHGLPTTRYMKHANARTNTRTERILPEMVPFPPPGFPKISIICESSHAAALQAVDWKVRRSVYRLLLLRATVVAKVLGIIMVFDKEDEEGHLQVRDCVVAC